MLNNDCSTAYPGTFQIRDVPKCECYTLLLPACAPLTRSPARGPGDIKTSLLPSQHSQEYTNSLYEMLDLCSGAHDTFHCPVFNARVYRSAFAPSQPPAPMDPIRESHHLLINRTFPVPGPGFRLAHFSRNFNLILTCTPGVFFVYKRLIEVWKNRARAWKKRCKG
jgi:hypothetical protein